MNERKSLALGAERIGLVAARAPVFYLAVVAFFSAIALYGAAIINTDDALTDLLKSNTHEYRDYENFRKLFPSDELDAYVVVETKAPLDAEKIEKLREFHFELGLVENVANVLSMFSVHERKGLSEPLVPVIDEELPEGDGFKQLLDRLSTDPRFANRFAAKKSDTTNLALFIASLDKKAIDETSVEEVLAKFAGELDELREATGLAIGMTGSPVMKAEILSAAKRDAVVFNIAGFALGFLLCFAFFQRWQYVVIVLVPTGLSVVCSLGLIGLMGIPLNPLMNTIIPLVMVISFANALHLVFAMRRKLREKTSVRDAIEHAVMKVGPACILSAVTTAIAFGSLALTDSHLIKMFGLMAALATSVSILLVATCVPCLAAIIFNRKTKTKTKSLLPKFSDKLDAFCQNLSADLAKNYRIIFAASVAFVIVWTTAYVQLDPRYRISDIIPDNGQAAQNSPIIDRHFGGLNVIQILILSPEDLNERHERMFAAVTEVEKALKADSRLANVRSINELRDDMTVDGKAPPLSELLEEIPDNVTGRYVDPQRRATLVSANARDFQARRMNQLRKDLDKHMARLGKQFPEFKFQVTGIATLSAERAIDTINSLNQAMMSAILIVLVLMGLLFRSLQVAVLSFCANLFAVVATGFCLFLFDVGLQYVSVVGLTVAFGLAVDDTVHFLNRYWLERNAGASAVRSVRTAVERVGPVLVLTTIVIICGLAATLTSSVPPTRMFGAICMATLVFALIGDVIVLPGAILMYQKLRPSGPATEPQDET